MLIYASLDVKNIYVEINIKNAVKVLFIVLSLTAYSFHVQGKWPMHSSRSMQIECCHIFLFTDSHLFEPINWAIDAMWLITLYLNSSQQTKQNKTSKEKKTSQIK